MTYAPASRASWRPSDGSRSEEHTSELQSRPHLVCRLLLEKKKRMTTAHAPRVLDKQQREEAKLWFDCLYRPPSYKLTISPRLSGSLWSFPSEPVPFSTAAR